MSDEHVAFLADQVRIRGYAVLETRLPRDRVAAMRDRFDALLAAKAASEPTNRGANRFQMYLPWEPPFTAPELYENDEVLAVVEAVMGPDPALVYFASDTPLPGSDYQRVHSDTRLLFPEASLSLPCYGLVLNVPLVDCTEENGSLEYWPGTHLMPAPLSQERQERLARAAHSERLNVPAGTLLVRDLRMWHRGTPNRSTRTRPHLALVYTRPWYRFEQQVPAVPRAAYPALSERARRLLRHARIEE